MNEQDQRSPDQKTETEKGFDNMHLTPAEHLMMGSTPAVSATENLFTLDKIDQLIEEDPDIFYKPITLLKNLFESSAVARERQRKQEMRPLFQAFQVDQIYKMFDNDISPVLYLDVPNELGLIEEARFRFENSVGDDEEYSLRPDLQKLFPFRTVTPDGQVVFSRNKPEEPDAV